MSAAGTPKGSEAAIAAVQKELGCWAFNVVGANLGQCRVHFGRWTDQGCPVAVAAADAAAPWIAAQALRDFADTRGINVGDEDDDWWTGYRQAQRECLQDAVKDADRIEAGQ